MARPPAFRDITLLDPNDPRHTLMNVKPSNGLSLLAAIRYYRDTPGAPRHAINRQALNTLNIRTDFRIKGFAFESMLFRFGPVLIGKLLAGDLVATGYADNRIEEAARPIASDRWRTLKPDFEASTAASPGLVISGILVFKERPEQPAPKRVAPAALRRWYLGWVSDKVAAGLRPSRDEDWKAACAALATKVPREQVRALRRELAPLAWQHPGRPETED